MTSADKPSASVAPSWLDRALRVLGPVGPREGARVLVWMGNLFVLLLAYYVLKTIREPMVLASGSAELKAYAAAGQALTLALVVPLYGWAMARLDRRRLTVAVGGVLVAALVAFLPAVHRAEVEAPAIEAAQDAGRAIAQQATTVTEAVEAARVASGQGADSQGADGQGVNTAVAPAPASVAAAAEEDGGVSLADFWRVGFWFYVFVGIFSVASIAQFWSLANDMHTRAAGERLFPIIAIGGTVGAASGAAVASALFSWGATITTMLWVTILATSVHVIVSTLVLARGPREETADTQASAALTADEARPAGENPGPLGGFAVVLADRYVLGLAALALLLNLVNTTGEYILGAAVKDEAARLVALGEVTSQRAFIGAFYGRFFFIVNLLTIGLQSLVAARLVRILGVRAVVLALPIVALGTYGLVAAGAGFAVFRIAKMLENATDYSIMNTARALLWLPTTPAQKYAGKQAVDTFLVRAGDVLSGGLVFVGTSVFALQTRGFALVNLGLIALWFVLALWLARAYHTRAAHAEDTPDQTV